MPTEGHEVDPEGGCVPPTHFQCVYMCVFCDSDTSWLMRWTERHRALQYPVIIEVLLSSCLKLSRWLLLGGRKVLERGGGKGEIHPLRSGFTPPPPLPQPVNLNSPTPPLFLFAPSMNFENPWMWDVHCIIDVEQTKKDLFCIGCPLNDKGPLPCVCFD